MGLAGGKVGFNELLMLSEILYFVIDLIDESVRVLLELPQLIQSDVADQFQYVVIVLHQSLIILSNLLPFLPTHFELIEYLSFALPDF